MSEVLTMEELEKHVLKSVFKTIIGSISGSLVVALIACFSFYYKTTSGMDRLNEITTTLTQTANKHSEDISTIKQGYGMTGVEQDNFDKRLTSIEDSQKEILKVLLEINASQKK